MRITVQNDSFSLPLSSFTLRGLEEHLCPVCNCYVPELTTVCPGCGERFPFSDEEQILTISPEELDAMILRRKKYYRTNPITEQEIFCLEDERKKYRILFQQANQIPIQFEPSDPASTGSITDKTMWIRLGTLFLVGIAAIILILHIPTSPKVSRVLETDKSTVEEVLPVEELPVLDYVEVYKHRQNYEGQTISIAGRISGISEDSIYFRERFFSDIDRSGFEIDIRNCLSQNETAYQRFECGQYVTIKGTVNNSSFSYSPELEGTDILCVGEDAKSHVDPLTEAWYLQGQTYAKTLPLTDYMDIVNNPDTFNGQRVRIAGRMQRVGANPIGPYFSFRNLENNFKVLSMDLRSCPVEMTAVCEEDVYVVVSGVVNDGPFLLELIDCYIECVGEEAEAIAMQSEADWWQHWQERRNAYISECQAYSYDQLARYSEQYNGSQITVSGRVVKIDVGLGSDNVLLDVGDGNQMYVCYSGKQYRDPEILTNDQITFYGTYSGKQNYAFSDTEEERLPYLIARYSSINL